MFFGEQAVWLGDMLLWLVVETGISNDVKLWWGCLLMIGVLVRVELEFRGSSTNLVEFVGSDCVRWMIESGCGRG